MKYILFLLVLVFILAVCTQNFANIEILVDFFISGFLGYCAARFQSNEKR